MASVCMAGLVGLTCGGTMDAVAPPKGASSESVRARGRAPSDPDETSRDAETVPPADAREAVAELAWDGTATVGDISVEARPGPVRRRAHGRTVVSVDLVARCQGGAHSTRWYGDRAVWAEIAACGRALVFTADAPQGPLHLELLPLRPVDLAGALARVRARAERAGVAYDGDAGVVEAGVADVEVRRGDTVVLRCRIGTASGREACQRPRSPPA
ncbi:MAG: hypothetical protein D6705_06940 [Deltaproteobacteria bacterium]|nr:MAG: hypothetical protein D6705_06940 [Deltaproteobacteria bacterium]